MKRDITTEEDIQLMVHTFYDRVRQDSLLGPVFEDIIKDKWDEHLSKMCDFWSTLILYTRKYTGDPMSRHQVMPIDSQHFGKWLALFTATVDELFAGENAQAARNRAQKISHVMQHVIGRQ